MPDVTTTKVVHQRLAIESDAAAIAAAEELGVFVAKDASDRDRQRRLPYAEVDALKSSGLLGITIPTAFGGADVSIPTLVEVFRILASADPSVGQLPQNHFSTVEILRSDGSASQREHYFSQILEGGLMGNATSERGTKDVFRGLQTRLTSDSNGELVLNGRKYYSTGALLADWVSVFALNEQDQIVTVIIERGAPGLEIVDDWSSIGQRTTASGTTIFNDVQVRSEQVIEHWHTYDRPNVFGALLQIMHVAIDVGIADAAIEDTVSFIRERSRPWFQSGVERASDDPHTIKRLGELIVQRDAAHAMLQRAASVLQKVRAAPVTAETATEASLAVAGAKAVATEAAIAITNELFALCGTSSADVEHNLDRHWRNARVHTLHDPVRWKYHHIGNFALNGEVPASSGWL